MQWSVDVQVYELASRNQSIDRNEVLTEWRKTGGVLVMGYQLFRILVSYSGKSRKTKQLYESALINPGYCYYLLLAVVDVLAIFNASDAVFCHRCPIAEA